MARKVFISFLGSNNYSPCHYCCEGYKSEEVRYVQEATLDYLTTKEVWTDQDVVLILLTKGAESANWVDDGHKNRSTGETIKQSGLYTRLKKKKLHIEISPIRELPDGNDEEEILEIFMRIFEKINDKDELYFDLTHGFRYLPMLVLVLGNYTKFLKNVTIKHISYGNFEARDKNTNEAKLIDLLPFNSLQEWTFAAGQYVESGNVDKIVKLGTIELKPILRLLAGSDASVTELKKYIGSLSLSIDDLRTCRGINIVNSTNISQLKVNASKVSNSAIKPLTPILEKIVADFCGFNIKADILNGYAASEWCYKNGLYQQAITILQENIVTHLCMDEGLKWNKEAERDIIEKALYYSYNGTKEEDWEIDPYNKLNAEQYDDKKSKIKSAIENQKLIKICHVVKAIKDIRNDYNHSGIRNAPMPAQKIKDKIAAEIGHVKDIFLNDIIDKRKDNLHPLFINLTSHPSAKWGEVQRNAAMQYGKIEDVSFPMVQPNATHEEILMLAEDLHQAITEKYGKNIAAVHIMGEFTLCYALIQLFKADGIKCLASTTERIVTDNPDGTKTSTFKFVQFREY